MELLSTTPCAVFFSLGNARFVIEVGKMMNHHLGTQKRVEKKVELHLQSELNLWLILWHPFARSRSSSDHHVYRRSHSTNEAAQSQIENQSTATWISRLQSTIVATFPNFSVKRWFYQLPYQRQDALRRNSAAPAIPPGQQTPGRSALGCGVFFKILDPAPSVVGHCGY